MIKLGSITKKYHNNENEALGGITLSFLQNEFTFIIGESGSGKTTLLNILGGLDHHFTGQFYINDEDTGVYNEKDWNNYRAANVGFIFQSYHLNNSLTILDNVLLALDILDIKENRIQRAKEAIDRVGLKGRYNAKPTELSGGEQQRVSIARAIVKKPSIILADEPTGNLDQRNSKEIINLLKEIQKDCLVIVVTHNTGLASLHADRIIQLENGLVKSDVYVKKTENIDSPCVFENKKTYAKISFISLLLLSFKNLIAKKTKTILTTFICTISLFLLSFIVMLSVSITDYTDQIQTDLLAKAPIKISSNFMDFDVALGLLPMFMQQKLATDLIKNGDVNINSFIGGILDANGGVRGLLSTNEIDQYVTTYLLELKNKDYVKDVLLDYAIEYQYYLYTNHHILNSQPKELKSLGVINNSYRDILTNIGIDGVWDIYTEFEKPISIINENQAYVMSQYDIIKGKMPTNKNEAIIVLNPDNSIDDILLARLGLISNEDFINRIYYLIGDPRFSENLFTEKITVDTLLNTKYQIFSNNQVFKKNESISFETNPFYYKPTMDSLGEEIQVVGVLKLKEGRRHGALRMGLCITNDLNEYFISLNYDSQITNFFHDEEFKALDYKLSISKNGISSGKVGGSNVGIIYEYDYLDFDMNISSKIGFVGNLSVVDIIMLFISPENMSSEQKASKLSLSGIAGNKIPETIFIFVDTLEAKKLVHQYINKWNTDSFVFAGEIELGISDRHYLKIPDFYGVLFAMIDEYVGVISTSMIIIMSTTLIICLLSIAMFSFTSVLERTREIGLMRAIGTKKSEVSTIFIIESLFIGLVSGVIAIAFTGIGTLLVNLTLKHLLGNVFFLKGWFVALFIGLGLFIAFIGSLIPSLNAGSKDPIEALRTYY